MSNGASHDIDERVSRPLSGVEKLVWVMSRRMPLNFVVTLRLRGPFSGDDFRRASREIRSEYRGLAVRVAIDADGRIVYEHDERVPNFPVVEHEAESDDAWQSAALQQLAEPFDSTVGPLARFVVLRRGDHVDLLAVCDHGVADGLSAVNLLRDVCRRMAAPDEAVRSFPLPQSVAERIPPEVHASREVRMLRRWGPRVMQIVNFCQEVKRRLTFQPRADVSAYVERPRDADLRSEIEKRQARVLAWTVSTDLLGRLTKSCRREQTTVQAALCVAFARTYEANRALGVVPKRRIQSPINVRKQLQPPVEQGAGLYNLLAHTLVDGTAARPFWDDCRAFRKRLEADLRPSRLFGGVLLTEDILGNATMQRLRESAHAVLAMKISHTMSISNLGRIDMPTNFGALRVEAIHGPAVLGQENAPVLGVATFGERMTFTMVAQASAGDEATIRRLVDGALQQLHDASAPIAASPD